MRVGVLALQGGYDAHARCLEALGHQVVRVKTAEAFEGLDGLVLPGGESGTHLRLLDRFDMSEALDALVQSGVPLFGTCAGMILSAAHVTGPAQRSFGWIDIDVARNGWGRQVHSFEAAADAPLPGDTGPLNILFIRAPRITRVGEGVEVLAAYKGEPIMVRQGNRLAAAFHPELTDDLRIHRLAFGEGS